MRDVNPIFWSGRRVLITGHTGFKGSWLSLWLQAMGADVSGLALDPPTDPSLFEVARVADGMTSIIADVRDFESVRAAVSSVRPEVVIHMAAQPLVRLSYRQPVETYSVNVMGTVHVMEAVRRCGGVTAMVNVTTDKCYENREWLWGYREDDPMGGHDPYSNSKGCSELITNAYRVSFFDQAGTALASARAGNVIGGGDWASDRLIPDILQAFQSQRAIEVRNPLATRPWQHVLEPLSGYLLLAQQLADDGDRFAGAWNFGPHDRDVHPVQWIVERMASAWGSHAAWRLDESSTAHEAGLLKLDISKAQALLGWRPRWELSDTLDHIVRWHRAWLAGDDMKAHCLQEIAHYTGSFSSDEPRKSLAAGD